ncbi:MAG: hypothetical protein HFJ41_04315 [Clostridia bacterium]|nr:hypothetical protein [Clostridia bacterium]
MRKYYIISIIGIIIFAILITIGVSIYKNTNSNLQQQGEAKNVVEKNEMQNNLVNSNIELVTTASEEEKTSPNCLFIFKTYYKKCEHIKVEREKITETMVNKTREDLETIYKNWNIVTFRNNEVLFYKEEEGSCGEHYLLKELEGKIAIYNIDEQNNLNLYEETEILTNYLPEEDINRLKQGIRVEGKDKLNQALEDYE